MTTLDSGVSNIICGAPNMEKASSCVAEMSRDAK